jgi:hypothetical protein
MNNQIAQIFGGVTPPPGISMWGADILTTTGPTRFIQAIARLLIVGAGIFTLFNLIFAGYTFLSAGGDPKKIADAWGKIWQSLLGLTIAVGSFVLAAIFGQLLFGDYNALLQITIFGP